MTKEEFDAQTANSIEQRGVQVRGVANGFNIVATRTFLDADTHTAKFSINVEGVATNPDTLLGALDSFFRTGSLVAA